MNNIPWTPRDHQQSHVALQIALLVLLAMASLGVSIPIAADRSFGASSRQQVLASKRAQIAMLNDNIKPMRDAVGDIDDTRSSIDGFYSHRIPIVYSSITGRLGAVAIKSGVRLSQIQYTQGEPGVDLTEISMELGVSGTYAQVMRFVNGVERDQVFYIIRALSFTGQQGRVVNLRVRISSWMRTTDARLHHMESTSSIQGRSPSNQQSHQGVRR